MEKLSRNALYSFITYLWKGNELSVQRNGIECAKERHRMCKGMELNVQGNGTEYVKEWNRMCKGMEFNVQGNGIGCGRE